MILFVKTLHIILIAGWVGLIFSREFLWNNSTWNMEPAIQKAALFFVRRLDFILGILILITGGIMIFMDMGYLKFGWMHTKILLWIIVFGLGHVLRVKAQKLLEDKNNISPALLFNRLMLLGLMVVIILVEFKPF